MDTQQQVDYTNDCQQRVSAQTGVLETSAPLTVPAGTAGVQLPDEVVALYAVASGADELPRLSAVDYLRYRSASLSLANVVAWTLIGRTLYLLPNPSAATVLTLIYAKRSATIDSGSSLEVVGEYARVVERLVGSYALLDDGQPELAARALADYDADLQRLRLRAVRRGTGLGSTRIRLPGRLRP